MIIIGTAGHIDHGKSSIVKRITGTDPDRLPEEKRRGMTIDLGFAFYSTPDNHTIAFIDVPGHERFVRNMIAGAGGIDAVMLVVAADDGWMPQSEEHFQIIRLLGVRDGFIVINKCDLAEKQWLELLKQDVQDKVKGSFLADASILTVSAETGDGFDLLIDHLNTISETATSHRNIDKARLYIDRSFVRQGIGTVVTGTLRDGTFNVGQSVSIWPALENARIRSLQSNNREVEKALPGQRSAVSLTGIKKDLLVRGGVLSDREDLIYFADNPVLALRVHLLGDSSFSLSNRRRVLLIVGTSEVEGEIRVYDGNQIKPGATGIIFLKPDDPVYSLVGDHFIIRLPSPMVTLGGGVVLDHLKRLPRKRDLVSMAYLAHRNTEDTLELITSELHKEIVIPKDKLLQNARLSRSDIDSGVTQLVQSNRCGIMLDSLYELNTIAVYSSTLLDKVKEELKRSSHITGLTFDQISRLLKLEHAKTRVIINYLVQQKKLIEANDTYNLPNRGAQLSGQVQRAYDEIIKQMHKGPYAPPTLEKLAANGQAHREAIKYMLEHNLAHKCGSDFLFLNEVWNEIVNYIREVLSKENQLTVATLRDRFGFSRKFAIPILEETDRIKLTRRDGDVRVRGEKFES